MVCPTGTAPAPRSRVFIVDVWVSFRSANTSDASVAGWPYTEASLVFADRKETHTSTMNTRLRGAGAVPVGQTIASEFGGLNVSVTKLHGVTGNAWKPSQ